MDTLSVNDVLLHPSPEGLEIPDFPYTAILMFEDMHDPWIMNQIFHILGAHCEIRFTSCSFGGVTDTFRHFGSAESGGELRLAEIDQDIVPLLRVSDAHYLHITRCPSFDDTTILDAMGSQADGTFACVTYMRSLTISNCLNFSIAALRRLVESRLHLPDPPLDEWMSIATQIQSLQLFGDLPPISEADRAWFAANVPEFY